MRTLHRAAEADVVACDQDVDGFDLGDRRLCRRQRVRPAGKESRDAAGSKGDDEYDDTRGFHNASLSTNHAATRRVATVTGSPRPIRGRACRFHQVKVKAWLMRRIQIELIVGHSTGMPEPDVRNRTLGRDAAAITSRWPSSRSCP